MEKTELLPCPFCGGEGGVVRTKDIAQWWYGECRKAPCYSRNLASQTKEEAVARWNTRTNNG
jgi:Lar family restriction alleviation protein